MGEKGLDDIKHAMATHLAVSRVPWRACHAIASIAKGCAAGGAQVWENDNVVDDSPVYESSWERAAYQPNAIAKPVFGQKHRANAPKEYGTLELKDSLRGDLCEDVVRALYCHL